MERDAIIETARKIILENKVFVLATAGQDGAPWMRWMGGSVLDEPLTATMAALSSSKKMDQIRANPRAQLMFQTKDHHSVVTLTGTCEIVEEPEQRQRVWDAFPGLKSYASGPEDPGLGVIRFTTERVELILLDEYGTTPQVTDV